MFYYRNFSKPDTAPLLLS